jgi:hypothetical protein
VNALVAGGFDTDMLRQLNKLSAAIQQELRTALRDLLRVFPWAVLEIRWRRFRQHFGYVAALLLM